MAIDALVGGRMAGIGRADQVHFWLMTDAPAQVQIEYWPEDQPTARTRTLAVATGPEDGHTAWVALQGLSPATRYAYRPLLEGESVPGGANWTLTTQPSPGGAPRDLRIATGSCAYIPEQPYAPDPNPFGSGYGIFDNIAALKPDLMIWLGDSTTIGTPTSPRTAASA